MQMGILKDDCLIYGRQIAGKGILNTHSPKWLHHQALTLSFRTQWPVDVNWPPKKLLARNDFLLIKNPTIFCNCKSKAASLAVIYFAVGDLLSCFQSVFCMADNVAAGII